LVVEEIVGLLHLVSRDLGVLGHVDRRGSGDASDGFVNARNNNINTALDARLGESGAEVLIETMGFVGDEDSILA
jgi:hypothetical protein